MHFSAHIVENRLIVVNSYQIAITKEYFPYFIPFRTFIKFAQCPLPLPVSMLSAGPIFRLCIPTLQKGHATPLLPLGFDSARIFSTCVELPSITKPLKYVNDSLNFSLFGRYPENISGDPRKNLGISVAKFVWTNKVRQSKTSFISLEIIYSLEFYYHVR